MFIFISVSTSVILLIKGFYSMKYFAASIFPIRTRKYKQAEMERNGRKKDHMHLIAANYYAVYVAMLTTFEA